MNQIRYDERKLRELVLYAAARLRDDRAGGATKLNTVLYFAEFAAHAAMTSLRSQTSRTTPITGIAAMTTLPSDPSPPTIDSCGRPDDRIYVGVFEAIALSG